MNTDALVSRFAAALAATVPGGAAEVSDRAKTELWVGKVVGVDIGPPATYSVTLDGVHIQVGVPALYTPAIEDAVWVLQQPPMLLIIGPNTGTGQVVENPNGKVLPIRLGNDVVSVGVYQQRFRTFSAPIQILGVSAVCGFGFGPSVAGSDIVLDLLLGDTAVSLWALHPSNRPTIAAGTEQTDGELTPDTTVVPGGSSLRAAVVSVGHPVPGSAVIMHVRWRWA